MSNLRKRAEKTLEDYIIREEEYSPEAAKNLLHELRVHQVELEMQNLELLDKQAELERSRKKYADLYDFAPVGYCSLEKDGTIREINLTAATQLGKERERLLNTKLYHFIEKKERDTFFLHLRQVFETQTRQTCELRFLNENGASWYAHVESIVFPADEGHAKKETTNLCRTTLTDITERKHIEEQLRLALQEIHHRTRNNMSAIDSLLSMQSERIDDPRIVRMFQDIRNRIQAMAMVHGRLYREDLTRVNLKEYIEELTFTIRSEYQTGTGQIMIDLDTEAVSMSIDGAVPFGLLLNELLSNTLKHAFPDDHSGMLNISLHETENDRIELKVKDDGVGLPEDFEFGNTDSIGARIALAVIEGFDGTLEFHRLNPGTEVIARFTKPDYKIRF